MSSGRRRVIAVVEPRKISDVAALQPLHQAAKTGDLTALTALVNSGRTTVSSVAKTVLRLVLVVIVAVSLFIVFVLGRVRGFW